MKRILSIAAVLVLALPAMGQLVFMPFGGVTVTNGETRTSTTYARLANTRIATVQASFYMNDSSTDTITVYCDGSLDGATFVNESIGSFALTANNTSKVTGTTNLDVGANILMRIRVANGGASASATNVVVYVGVKRGVEPTLPLPIIYGGTEGATAAAARSALGLVASTNGVMSGMSLVGSTTNLGLTASLPVFTDANKVLASKTIANTKLALGIQSGSVTTSADGTVTNTFGTAFSTAPVVLLCQTGDGTTITNTVTVTTTNFTYSAGAPSIVAKWLAIGAP